MQVLMFGWEFPPHISGGLGTACFGLTQGLIQQGVSVLFVVPKMFGSEVTGHLKMIDASTVNIRETEEIIKKKLEQFTYFEAESSIVPYIDPIQYADSGDEDINFGNRKSSGDFRLVFSGHYHKDLFKEVDKYALVSSQIARKHAYEVIHAHDWLTFPAGIMAKKISGKPLVVHIHATEFDRSGEHINKRIYEIEKHGMEEAKWVITVSNLTRNKVIQRYGIDPDKVVTIYNGVLPSRSRQQFGNNKLGEEKVVTFLGRITFQKGPDYFVEAAGKVLEKCRNVHFVMAGSGNMIRQMIQRVAGLRIGARFHFTGFLSEDEVQHMLAITDVFVMPSVSEPFGIVPLEALQADVPVIISKQSGVAEVLKNALKVDFWDTDQLANAIFGLLKYRGLNSTLLENGKKEVQDLNWQNASMKVHELYKSIQEKTP